MEQLLSYLDGVKKVGKKYWARCPLHTDKTPSMQIKESNGGLTINCFSCGANGLDIYNHFNLDFAELFGSRHENKEKINDHVPASKRAEYEHELIVKDIYQQSIKNGKTPSFQSQKRFRICEARIQGLKQTYTGIDKPKTGLRHDFIQLKRILASIEKVNQSLPVDRNNSLVARMEKITEQYNDLNF